MQRINLSNGCGIDVPDGVSITVVGGQPNPNPTPIPPSPLPTPPLPPGVGYAVINPPTGGQQKYFYNSAMILDLVNQPAGRGNQLGVMRTAPQIGGDLEAGGATLNWVDPDGVSRSLSGDAPVTVWYSTDQLNEGALIRAQVGSTIRLSVLSPVRPWFLDYRTPNA